MWAFSWYMSRNLVFKNLFHGFLEDAIGAGGVLAFRTILKMCYKLSSEYLATKDVAKGIKEGLKLRAELGLKSFWAESLSNWSILLSVGEKTQNIGAIKGITET